MFERVETWSTHDRLFLNFTHSVWSCLETKKEKCDKIASGKRSEGEGKSKKKPWPEQVQSKEQHKKKETQISDRR